MIVLRGVVTKITFYNDDNGFGIVKIRIDYKNPQMLAYRNIIFSNALTVLSTFDRKPIVDEEYEFSGEFETSTYGLQLRASSFKRINENTEEGIVTYLASEFFPGVGKTSAQKVYDALKEDAFEAIINDKTVLDKIDISEKQKVTIYENLVIHYQNEKQLVDLLNLGMTLNLAIKVIRILKDNAYEQVKENPYCLIDFVEGIGFFRADGIALNMGISKDSPKRIEAMILYVLKRMIYSSGDTYYHFNDLRTAVMDFANSKEDVLDVNKYQESFDSLLEKEKIIMDSERLVYDKVVFYQENILARKIYEFLSNDSFVPNKNLDELLIQVMYKNNIEYTDKQKEAIKKAITEPIMIVTGGPGTGKSTIIKGIVDTYALMFNNSDMVKEKIMLVAPTGRASKRLQELTKYNSCTIHKLLEYKGSGIFDVGEDNPLDLQLLIIDEFSMVDLDLAYHLFKSLLPQTKIIIVGDVDQLPAVGCGNVLEDLIDSKEITTIRLDQIHRQANDSSIISLAHDINHGILNENMKAKKNDYSWFDCNDESIIKNIITVIKNGIEKGMDILKDIQVLVPIYKGMIGIEAINYALQDEFNKDGDEVNYHGHRFRVNDKVIQLVNRSEKKIMNGDIGYIYSIKKEENDLIELTVMYDNGCVTYNKEEIDDLFLAYAISIHKAQGSEFPLVIVPLSFKYYIMLKKKLIYTAITRAKKYLILMGNFEAFARGIVSFEKRRNTKLVARIKAIIDNPKIIFDTTSSFEKQEEENMENITPYDFLD